MFSGTQLGKIDFEQNAGTGAIPPKLDELIDSLSVQAFDGVVQPTFGTDVGIGGQGIIDACWPAFFFECVQHGFLVGGGPFKSLDYKLAQTKLPFFRVPNGLQLVGLGNGGLAV